MEKVVKFRAWMLEEISKDPSTQGRREDHVTMRPHIAQAL